MSTLACSPGEFGASGERGSLAEIDVPGSPAHRLGGEVNTYPLSFDSEVLESGGALSGSGAVLPSWLQRGKK
jgi:hypothetical protein